MEFSHYRCDWHHPRSAEPVTLLYEVSEAGDVPRVINIYADGRTECRAVADFAHQPKELPGLNSMVEGSFFEALVGHEIGVPRKSGRDTITISEISRAEFRQIWCDQRGY